MKKIILIILVLIVKTSISSAQIGLRVYNYRPTGSYGALFKPTIAAELGYIDPFEDRLRNLATLTVLYLKPRMSEFPITGVKDNSSGTKVYPGTQSFKMFLMFQAHGGVDYAFVKKEKYSIFGGANVLFGWTFIHYTAFIDGMSDEEGYVSGRSLGARLRLGAEYQVTEQTSVFFSANRTYYRMFSEYIGGNYWSNDYGIGMTYCFER